MTPPARARLSRGYAALMLSLSTVVAVSVIGAGAVAVGIADTRRVAHEQRRQEAQATAESALDRAILRLRLNVHRLRALEAGGWMEPGRERWQRCDEAAPRAPCAAADGTDRETFGSGWTAYGPIPALFASHETGATHATASYVARVERPGESGPGWSTIHVVAEGRSPDGGARARLRRSYQLHPLIRRLPRSPIEFTGALDLAGGLSIVAADGVPLQAHRPVDDALTLLFGPGAADAEGLRAQALRLDDCSPLGAGSRGLIWIAGPCIVSTASAIGAAASPVVLVVDSEALHVQAPVDFFGILVLRSATGGRTTLRQETGPAVLHGAVIADGTLEVLAEDLTIRYDPAVLLPLLHLAGQLSEVGGSWTDHR
jgi:hypothetical protein